MFALIKLELFVSVSATPYLVNKYFSLNFKHILNIFYAIPRNPFSAGWLFLFLRARAAFGFTSSMLSRLFSFQLDYEIRK